jgi:DNA mismatch repair protein MutL
MTDQGETAIRPLDDRTVERIAAGEVVERPASAVKELVENSIDADASTVDVAVDGDGTDLLRVSDDGHGMTEADVRAAVRAHTTSKIADIDDLERGVGTLGFRGEALHTIGAVSRMAIETKPRDATVAGTRLEYEGGTVVGVAPVGCPAGTTVTVRDLFYNTPARRKYLKQEATEFAHVSRVVSRYALANPDVAVSLAHDGRETFATSGEGDLQTAIMAVYGREVATAMVPVVGGEPPAVAADLDGLVPPAVEVGVDPDPAAPVEGIAGYVSHPETTRSSADYVSAFVDGRYVRSSTVRDAVVEAYGDQLASDRYPFTVLFLSTEPGSVDVNVHPRKTEVRFEDDATVRRSVRDAVRAALLDHGVVRSSAPRGRSAPDDTPVDPARAADEGGETPTGEERPTPAAHETGDAGRRGAGASGSDDTRRASGPTEASGGAGEGRGSRSRPAAAGSAESSRSHDGPTGTRAGGDAESEDGEPRRSNGDVAANDGDARQFEAPSEQRTLDGERAAPAPDGERLPSMRVLGQLADTYVVAETDDGLVLVDQHAADERVQYERLRRRLDDTGRQRLADPVDLSVTAAEAATVETAGDALERLGFEVDRLDAAAGDGDDDDRRRVRVTAVPAAVEAVDPELLRDVLAAVVGGTDPAASVEAAADAVLADLACHPSVTGNTSLTEGRVTDLLSALDDCENPYACPHGRPTLVRVDREEIEGRFERDYPGHGGR